MLIFREQELAVEGVHSGNGRIDFHERGDPGPGPREIAGCDQSASPSSARAADTRRRNQSAAKSRAPLSLRGHVQKNRETSRFLSHQRAAAWLRLGA